MQKVLSVITALVGLVLAFLQTVQPILGGHFVVSLSTISGLAFAVYVLASGIVGIVGGPDWLKAILTDLEALVTILPAQAKADANAKAQAKVDAGQ